MGMSQEMQDCISQCLKCHATCLGMAMNHCLEAGGEHTEAQHFRTMMDCAEICQTSANFMLHGSEHHKLTCGVCAQVCSACAKSCASIDGMEECAKTCRECAEHCGKMSN